MNDLPNGWELLPLKDCVFFQEGPGLRKWQFGESGIPFLNIRTFNNGTIDKTKCQFVKLADFTGKYEHFLLDEGDIVVSSSGTLGKLVVVRKQDLPLMLNTSVIRYRSLYPEHLLQSFLKIFLQSHHFSSQIQSAKTGSAILNYGPSHIKEMEIIVPPLKEQRRIVAMFERLSNRVDAAQDRLATIPRILKRFRQSVLAAACSGHLTKDWRDQNKIRQGQWAESKLTDLLLEPLSNGRSVVDATHGFPVLRLTCLKNGRIDLSERKIGAWTADAAKKVHVLEGDFLVSRGNGSLSHVGRGGLVEEKPDPVAFPDTLIRVRLRKDLIDPRFLREVWRSSRVRDQIESAAHTTAGIWKISQKDIEAFVLPVPALTEQQEIVRRVETLFKTADALEARYRTAKAHVDKLTQSILAKAFRGELVPQDPDDESASILFERIKKERGPGREKSELVKRRNFKNRPI